MTAIWTPEEEAERLTKRFENVPNKAEFARVNDVPGGASMLSQNCSGNRPISLEAAIAYAKGFEVTIDQISPRRAAELQAALLYLEPEGNQGPHAKSVGRHKAEAANDGMALVDEVIDLVVAYKTARPKDRLSIMNLAKVAAERATQSRAAPDEG